MYIFLVYGDNVIVESIGLIECHPYLHHAFQPGPVIVQIHIHMVDFRVVGEVLEQGQRGRVASNRKWYMKDIKKPS